jgi:hypothetical protein
MLLDSVFDLNSHDKWMYDWTVSKHGAEMPITDMAGELWLLLLQLAGKKKRSEDCLPRIRTAENREMVQDFIESGARLTDKIKNLLKACEKTAWELANIKSPTDGLKTEHSSAKNDLDVAISGMNPTDDGEATLVHPIPMRLEHSKS